MSTAHVNGVELLCEDEGGGGRFRPCSSLRTSSAIATFLAQVDAG